MKIETKFDIGEKVVTIENNSIVTLVIEGIEYNSIFKTVKYTLLKSKAVNFGDKDLTTVKCEYECFKSIQELASSYDSRTI